MAALRKIALWTLLALTFLAPFKFVNLIGVPGADPVLPAGVDGWLWSPWPAALFSILAAPALALALAAWQPRRAEWRSALWVHAGLWTLVFASAWIGIVNATIPDYALNQIEHLAGLVAYLAAVTLCLNAAPRHRDALLDALAVAWIGVVLAGIYQFCFGFSEMRQFVAEQEAQGVAYAAEIRGRSLDTRITAYFSSSNAFAGFMLLATPAAVWRFRCWAERFEPVKVSRWIFTVLPLGLALALFAGARSRAAILALVLAVGIYVWSMLRSKKLKLAVLLAAAAVIAAGSWTIVSHGRGLGSMVVRADYYVVGAKLLAAHPLAGAGWGEFGHHYMRNKVFDVDESTQDPHSIVMTMAAQCGLLGLLAILAAVGFVLWRGWRLARAGGEKERLLWFGLLAFMIHALVELHLQVVGAMAPALVLAAVLLAPKEEPERKTGGGARIAVVLAGLALALAALGGGWYWLRGEYAYRELCQTVADGRAAPTVAQQLEAFNRTRPGSPYGWLTAGDYFAWRGLPDKAESCYLQAAALSPENSMIYGRLAEVYRRRDPALAAEWAAKALERNPNNDKYRQIIEAAGL